MVRGTRVPDGPLASRCFSNLRRSLTMLTPHAPNALSREQAIALVEELEGAERRLRSLREGLERLLEEDQSSR